MSHMSPGNPLWPHVPCHLTNPCLASTSVRSHRPGQALPVHMLCPCFAHALPMVSLTGDRAAQLCVGPFRCSCFSVSAHHPRPDLARLASCTSVRPCMTYTRVLEHRGIQSLQKCLDGREHAHTHTCTRTHNTHT